jgi:hypothetical protein
MNAPQGSCPFDEATRASRCQGCYETNGILTPCVTSWLRHATDELLPLTAIDGTRPLALVRKELRQAA